MMTSIFRSLFLFLVGICLGASPLQGQEGAPDFQRDIQPIFAEHCSQCHGADEKTREAGLRLDTEEGLRRGGDSGSPTIVPGNAAVSEMMKRVRSSEPDEQMPPPGFNKPLSDSQKELLDRWIANGAKYSQHWAFVKPKKPTLTDGSRHPIDQLIAERLASKNLVPNPIADSRTLCRRLYLDVIGLPPSPQEFQEFERIGYEATLDKLMASERFGEKWARHWLDVARYSDTHGYEKDLRREQWIWRDWVVDALNNDMPYDRFVVEQIAGDLLPNATQSQRIATGFLRNSMLNLEGAIVPEQFRMVELFDRIDCVGKAVLGLSTQCAQCHSHKFDPISHKEYYGMFAFLNNSYEAQSWIYNADQQKQVADVVTNWKQWSESIRQAYPDWEQRQASFIEKSLAKGGEAWQPVAFHQLEAISGLNHPVQMPDGTVMMLGHASNDIFFVGKAPLAKVTGVQLEILTHGDLPFHGPGRSELGTWTIQEVECFTKSPNETSWTKRKLVDPTSDFSNDLETSSDKKKSSGPVSHLVDGSDETTWTADRGMGRRNQSSVAVMRFESSLELPADTEIKFVMRMGDMVGCCRVSLTNSDNPRAQPIPYTALLAMRKPVGERSEADGQAIFEAWSLEELGNEKAKGTEETWKSLFTKVWTQYPAAVTSVLHLAERTPEQRRATHLLERGEWDRPTEEVQPKVLAALHPFRPEWTPDRLGFAQWLVAPESPLAARVLVNRHWQSLFGVGLVETAEDFGTRAPYPVHQDVLDWLAVDFMEKGWSQKRLLRTILMSDTYRRSSALTPELLEQDPNNVWLARGPRFRAEAEVIRDIALSVAGKMTHRLGGPSIIPPVPKNVLDYNYTYPSYWEPAQGPERYRRALYMFRKRSMPDPVLTSLDAPNGDFACARRVLSNTPIAALVGLNEPIFVEAAQSLALRILREGGQSERERAQFGFEVCTGRLPTDQELEVLVGLLQQQRQRLSEGWLNPKEIATGDAKLVPELPNGCSPLDAAAWTLVARVLINLDETITKN